MPLRIVASLHIDIVDVQLTMATEGSGAEVPDKTANGLRQPRLSRRRMREPFHPRFVPRRVSTLWIVTSVLSWTRWRNHTFSSTPIATEGTSTHITDGREQLLLVVRPTRISTRTIAWPIQSQATIVLYVITPFQRCYALLYSALLVLCSPLLILKYNGMHNTTRMMHTVSWLPSMHASAPANGTLLCYARERERERERDNMHE